MVSFVSTVIETWNQEAKTLVYLQGLQNPPIVLIALCIEQKLVHFYIFYSYIHFGQESKHGFVLLRKNCKKFLKNLRTVIRVYPVLLTFSFLLNSTATWCTYGHLFRFPHYTITIIFVVFDLFVVVFVLHVRMPQ